MKKSRKISTTVACILLSSQLAGLSIAAQYPMPPEGVDLVGEITIAYPRYEDTLLEIGERYEMGFDELKWANPNVNTWVPGANTPVIIPAQYILPKGVREGIVLNIPEMRAYYFPKDKQSVYIYPVSVGRMDWKTPLGKSYVTAKQKDPAWYPPESIQREHLEDGRGVLGKYVAPGPNNPLGQHVLRLSLPSYLLHGTNDSDGIGMRVTHGCMRFFPKNIEELYNIVPLKTSVYIINQPVKIGWDGERLMIETNPTLEEDNLSKADVVNIAHELLISYQNDESIELNDIKIIDIAIEQMSGIPVQIGRKRSSLHTQENSYEDEDIQDFNPKMPLQLISQ
ncbi:L,D-transpeptidase linking Lpp to murein [Gammaproteobacteria bacterium]|nr:L,D-transpeptidase linking Lpp to murein [Gammaproteobacteria bacterium]